MNEDKILEILQYAGFIYWEPNEKEVEIDSKLTVEQVEAIAWWMRHSNTKLEI